MTDLNDLIIRTGYLLNEASATSGYAGVMDGFANASPEAKQFVNWAYRDVLRLLPLTGNKDIGVKSALLSWVAGTETYDVLTTIAPDFQFLKRLEGGWDESSESLRYDIPIVDYSDRGRFYSDGYLNLTTGLPEYQAAYIVMEANATPTVKIGFCPVPASTKTNNVKMWYWPTGPTLTATGDHILPIAEGHDKLICLKAAIYILRKSGLDSSLLEALHNRDEEEFKENIRNMQRQHPNYAPETGANDM